MSAKDLIGTKWIIDPCLDNPATYVGVVSPVECEDPDSLMIADGDGNLAVVHKTRLRPIEEDGSLTWGVRELKCKYHFKPFADLRISYKGALRMFVSGKLISFPLQNLLAVYMEDVELEPGEEPHVPNKRIHIQAVGGSWWFTVGAERRVDAQLLVDTLIKERDIANGFIEE